MNSKTLVSAVMAISLATGGFAYAQDHGDRGERGRSEQARGDGERHGRDNQGRGHDDERRDERRDGRGNERGAGPNHDFYRGERLPAEYRHRQYVVDDWRGHRLDAPPRGYHWIQTGGDYVLVAIATGIIAQLLLNH